VLQIGCYQGATIIRKALPHAIALGLVVKGKTPALHETNDIVLCQIEDKASDHIRRSCDHKRSLELIAHPW
jgi:hypothetical protein